MKFYSLAWDKASQESQDPIKRDFTFLWWYWDNACATLKIQQSYDSS